MIIQCNFQAYITQNDWQNIRTVTLAIKEFTIQSCKTEYSYKSIRQYKEYLNNAGQYKR